MNITNAQLELALTQLLGPADAPPPEVPPPDYGPLGDEERVRAWLRFQGDSGVGGVGDPYHCPFGNYLRATGHFDGGTGVKNRVYKIGRCAFPIPPYVQRARKALDATGKSHVTGTELLAILENGE